MSNTWEEKAKESEEHFDFP